MSSTRVSENMGPRPPVSGGQESWGRVVRAYESVCSMVYATLVSPGQVGRSVIVQGKLPTVFLTNRVNVPCVANGIAGPTVRPPFPMYH